MKRIYLVKEYQKHNQDEFTWIQMNRQQFNEFLKTDEAKGRYFMTLPEGVDHSTDHIVIETDRESYIKYRSEKRNRQYLNEWRKKKGYKMVSLESYGDNHADHFQTDDPEHRIQRISDVEDCKRLLNIIALLDAEEQNLLKALYFSDKRKTEGEIGETMGISQQVVSYRKKKLLKKLREYL